MADWQQVTTLEGLVDTEVGSLTLANLKSYYATYLQEQSGSKPVSWADYLAVLESYYRNSAIAGEA